MKFKELQRKGDNLYLLTYEVGFWIFKKEIRRYIYQWNGYMVFVDNDSVCYGYDSIKNLIDHLQGYKPLIINEL